jgi:hypothetical protein
MVHKAGKPETDPASLFLFYKRLLNEPWMEVHLPKFSPVMYEAAMEAAKKK